MGSAISTIWGSQRPQVSAIRLYTPVDRGGFGLFNLKLQLQGPRAEWIYSLLHSSSFSIRYLRQIRVVLVTDSLLGPRHLVDQMNRLTTTPQIWTWYALLCHPGSFGDGLWSETISTLTALLPSRWIIYLQAWNSFSSLSPTLISTRTKWNEKVLKPTSIININSTIPKKFFTAPGSEPEEGIQSTSFSTTISHLNLHYYQVIIPNSSLALGITSTEWKKYWLALRKFRNILPTEENSAHLLSLGSLHPGSQQANPQTLEEMPHNGSVNCTLCLTESTETLLHLLVECPVSQSIWISATSSVTDPPIPHPSLREFTCPSVTKHNKSLLAIKIIFIHTIWKLSRSRRFSKSLLPLPVLHQTDLAKVGKKLETTWIYSGFKKGF